MSKGIDWLKGTTKHILVVDDEPAWIGALSMVLESKGYDVRSASSGAEALKTLKQYKPDLILSDVRMPDMNGFDFLDSLKKLPAIASTPVVFLSAVDDFHARKVARELGAADYILKPISEQDMLSTLEKYLSR
ncbi:MAG: response regulator [Ignavibacteriae bacterium]|nr:response regulator [Ignavibacteriota bacterium]